MRMFWYKKSLPSLLLLIVFSVLSAQAQSALRHSLRGHHGLPANARTNAVDRLAPTQRLEFTIGLPLRNQAQLDRLLQELSDPASPNYRKFLTPEQFTEQFGPTREDYQAVLDYARSNGFTVTETHPNRVLVSLSAPVTAVEKAFHVNMRHFKHPTEARTFFAPDAVPTLDLAVPIQDIGGLDDFVIPRSTFHPRPASATPQNGSAPGGGYMGADFRNAYAPDVALTGAGQSAGTINFAGYFQNDVRRYQDTNGIAHIPIVEVLLDGVSNITNSADGETVLDLEMLSSMAPGLDAMYFFRGTSIDSMLSAIAATNVCKQIGASWLYGVTGNSDNLWKQLAAQGITFFNAVGDYDAYPAPDHPTLPDCAGTPYITSVGGTTLTMTGNGAAYGAEKVWNWSGTGGASGGISPTYAMPFWQQGIDMTANHGSTTMRNCPDVALTADNIFVIDSTSSDTNGFTNVGGESCATPLWAAFMALVNEQNAHLGQGPIGALNPLVYAIGKMPGYTAAFHDITVGNNTNALTTTNYFAVPGYDLCTGWGTPRGQATINALTVAPYLASVPPATLTAYAGSNLSLTVSAGGQATLAYQWQYDGQNISGATGPTLSFSNLQLTNSGSYRVIVANSYGSVTSTICALSVIVAPPYVAQTYATAPVAWWRLNETSGTLAYDSIGGNNGTNTGSIVMGVSGPAAPTVPGLESANTAYQFSSSSTRVALPALNLSSGALTLSAWVNPSTIAASYEGIITWSRPDVSSTLSLCLASGNNRLTYLRDGYVYNSSSLVVPTNQWTLVALVLSGTSANLYMVTNGIVASANLGNPGFAVEPAFTNTAYIANSPYGSFVGSIDEVALYNQPLTATQIGNLAQAAQTALPVVTLTAPTNGGVYSDGMPIALAASVAANGHSIAKVQFFNGATLLGESTTAPYQFTWTGAAPGTCTLLAQAVYDGSSTIGSQPATVTVNYLAPQLADDLATTTQNTPVTIPVLANDYDRYGFALAVQSLTQPARGTVALAGTNVVYTPSNYTYGLDTFSYTAGDGHGPVQTATVSVTTTYPNYASMATNALLANGAVACWRLNETSGATAYDFISGRNGTNNGSLVLGASGPSAPACPGFEAANTAYAFSGSGTSVSLPALNLGSNITLTAWVKPNADPGYYPGVISWSSAGTIISLGFGNHNTQLAYMRNGYVYSSATLTLPTNQWSFIALTATPTNALLYLATNAALLSFNTGTLNPALTSFTNVAYLGYNPNYGHYSGALDEVALFNQALSSSQLGDLITASQTALPAVTLTTPTNGSSFNSAATITLTASVATNGNHTVEKVQFLTNGTVLAEAITPPYTWSWNGAPAGAYTLLARASYDGSGTVDSTAAAITVTNSNHAPLPGALTLGAVANHAVTLNAATLVSLATDPEGDPMSVTAVSAASTNGAGVTLSSAAITYTPVGGYVGADSFTYTLSDNHDASATGTVTVTVVSDAAYNRLGLGSVSASQAALQFSGVPYNAYTLEWTHSLTPPINWQPVLTNSASATGVLTFTNAPSGTNDFYRIRWLSGQ